ncbi:MAG: hypothetical protein P4M12_00880 [Gammaproteobacteria bacterium]|nr:hypothetical protein [Gammaproteobacteria bacterium]
MLKKIILLSTLLLSYNLTYAENCPTVNELKSNNLQGWQALKIDNALPLSSADVSRFTNTVENFALAEWMKDAPEGAAHCYYTGVNKSDPHYLGVFLAKQHLAPKTISTAWHSMGMDIMLCHEGITECGFIFT